MPYDLIVVLCLAAAAAAFLVWKLDAVRRRLAERESELRARTLELERRDGLLQAVTRATSDGFILLSSDARVAYVNDAARSLLGLEDGVGKPLRDIGGGTELYPLLEMVERSDADSIDQIVTTGDKAFSVHVQAVGSRAKDGVLIRLDEITELQRLGRARRDFVANISHDLRTPVASLQLLVDTLTSEASHDGPFVAGLLGKMHLQIDLLRQLTDELMDLALIESGQAPIKLVETRAVDLVNEATGPLHPQADLKGIAMSASVDPATMVLADPQAIRKVLGNLIHNALKFTNSGGQIEIRVTPEGDNVQFAVADTGIGIPPSELPRVFERFYKVDRARARGAGELRGTGLGLAIAKHIVGAHGGTIWAASSEGKGSTFFFTLPAA
ncbi:MAG: cell wall metabolism sensor histidine kinase WalK [Chloroflexi bacterium]|nr:cell wall metabolism sensor histidine kinase WalK [Chloroflexota bacterium]